MYFIKNLLLLTLITLLSACAANKAIVVFETPPPNKTEIVELAIPIEIDLTYVDGKRHSFMPAYQAMVTYQLLQGKHVLGLKYQDMVLNEDGNQESVKSRTVIIRFTAKAGGKYKINFKKPSTFTEALKLEKSFKITLSDENGVISSSFPAPEAPIADWFGSKPFSLDANNLFNDEVSFGTNVKPADDAAAKAHLTYWWGQASDDEKVSFKKWVESNP